MITILKVNVLTDDEGLPEDLRERLGAVLQDVIAEDPEGAQHARVQLEWRYTIHNRAYMKGLSGQGAERETITAKRPAAPKVKVQTRTKKVS